MLNIKNKQITENEEVEIKAKKIICNADAYTTLKLLEGRNNVIDRSWVNKIKSIPCEGCTVKFNIALKELPTFKRQGGDPNNKAIHEGQVNLPLTFAEWQEAFDSMRSGQLYHKLWCEIYFHTALDRSVSPNGLHQMSVFAQYVPAVFADTPHLYTWSDEQREKVWNVFLNSILPHCENFLDIVVEYEVLGPHDIEEKIGLHGGHIFQGSCLPQHMWENRLTARTPMKNFYLCGVATHPGGSVIGIHGRNAAYALLEDEQIKI